MDEKKAIELADTVGGLGFVFVMIGALMMVSSIGGLQEIKKKSNNSFH